MGYANHRYALRLDDDEQRIFDEVAVEARADQLFYGKLTATRVFIFALKFTNRAIKERRAKLAAEAAELAKKDSSKQAADDQAAAGGSSDKRPGRAKGGKKK